MSNEKKLQNEYNFNLQQLEFATFKISSVNNLFPAITFHNQVNIKVIINISQHNERLVHGKKKKYVFRRCFCDSLDIFLHISNVNIKKFVNGTLLALKIPISLLEFFNKSLPLQMIEVNNYK